MNRFGKHVRMSPSYNAIFDTEHLTDGMIQAAIRNHNVGGCANSRKVVHGNAVPTDRWYASKLKSSDPKTIQNAFDNQVKNQIVTLRSIKRMPKRPVLAIDMHLIEYYGKNQTIL